MTGATLGPCNHVKPTSLSIYFVTGITARCTAIMDVPAVRIAHVATILHSETGRNLASRYAQRYQ